LEGLAYIFVSINKLHTSHNLTPIWSHSPIKYGALDLFAAALIVMISSAIHLHTPIFNMALVVKFLYLFFNTSTSMIFLTAQGITGALRAWVFVRTIAALLLLANDIGELVGPTQQPLEQLPGWDAGEDLNSDAPSSLRNSSVASHRA
jgi:hypothetical protein